MARVTSLLLLAGWLASDALGAPAPHQRVVLADPDPELRHAMEQALAPWHLQVVIEGPPPTDTAMARQRADADTARFVVWRDGPTLVVYDRELGSTEQRDSRAGVLDPPAAAAAALTIKTMMRLPPPPPPDEPSEPPPVTSAGSGIEVRIQAGLATRIARGDTTNVTARFGGAAAIRPWAGYGWRFGLAGDGGTSTSVDQASFKGTWREWAVLGFASWTYTRDAWEIEPHAGLGVRRSALDGTEMSTARTESATLAMARGGVWGRWRWTRWTVGAVVDVDDVFGTPTYTKTSTPAVIFQVPGFAVEVGLTIAVDL